MKLRILILGALMTLVLASLAAGQAPQLINYQGKLAKNSGGTLDTAITMVFSIYSNEYTSSYLWRETQPDVAVESGVFSVLLGSTTPIPASVFDGSVRYLGVRVGADAEMSPRHPVTSVAYSYNAAKADEWDGHNWGDTYPSASTADIWDGHHWGETYPTASNGILWNAHTWGEIYPSSSDAEHWAGHDWGVAYPTASNAELLDGLDGSQLLRSDVGGTINGSLTLAGLNYIKFLAGSSETIRYDSGALSPYHGMLLLIHPTRRFVFGTSNDGGDYVSTLMLIPAKGAVKITEGLEVTGQVSANSFQEISDSRLKCNVETLTGALDRLQQLRGVSFEWNNSSTEMRVAAGQSEIGVIAQEVESVYPELVSTWGDEQYRTVDYGRLTAVLIEAIKELRKENDDLRARIEQIEGEKTR